MNENWKCQTPRDPEPGAGDCLCPVAPNTFSICVCSLDFPSLLSLLAKCRVEFLWEKAQPLEQSLGLKTTSSLAWLILHSSAKLKIGEN